MAMHRKLNAIREEMRADYLADEAEALARLIRQADLSQDQRTAISRRAAELVKAVRQSSDPRLMEAFLKTYGLSTREGVALMCLAEALLRVPDSETMDDLIRDKIAAHDWSAHSGSSGSIFVNASTWGLMLTGKVLDEGEEGIDRTLRSMLRRLGEPVIRAAAAAAMREMGEQFVLGRTIAEALKRGRSMAAKGYLYSYDMLGEAARTEADALRYHGAYMQAISSLAGACTSSDISRNPGISVKLSAIHPRYEVLQKDRMLPVMSERLLALALAAREAQMGLNIDAEEADRLDLSLDVIEQVLSDPRLAGWDGFGVVVQAYGPRAAQMIDWLYALATGLNRRIMIRLVKGAYWDTEIKRAQMLGLSGYPVFTRKPNSDVSYIANARKLLSMTDRIYPQFATHNAHTMAAVLAMAANRDSFEFQRLHGMGEALHETVRRSEETRCRIYAPVGTHSDLLAYLVRRLLENGANSSFVHQIVDEEVPAEHIARDPFEIVETQGRAANPLIVAPPDLFGHSRRNSRGWDVTDPLTLAGIEQGRSRFGAPHRWQAAPSLCDAALEGGREIVNPADTKEIVGTVHEANAELVTEAVSAAIKAQPGWAGCSFGERSAILNQAADLYEANAIEFFALATREAGKTLADSVAELREAVDFLRYYAAEAGKAESGTEPRGVIACISPWNFPLAIFTGQIAAALVTGNAVIAKPAEQTPLIAARAVSLLREAGIPEDVIQLLPGDGPSVGAPLTADPRIAGVCFTGSTEVARQIERQLSRTAAPDAMLIAETGGLNAMIVDSTALPEQAVRDIVASAFQSAGQRCSALRIVYIQKDIENKVMEMLTGAVKELSVGDPWQFSTDVGPVIDDEARRLIDDYCRSMRERSVVGRQASTDLPEGRFVLPQVLRVKGIEEMEREIFGPVLHVATFEADEIDKVISAINNKGYGLTFGLHTRIENRVQHLVERIHAGNIYVNRNQIGAVVGSQPFGGEGLSGTGPKAGGMHYLRRFRKSPVTDGELATGSEVTAAMLAGHFPEPSSGGWNTRSDRIAVLRGLVGSAGAGAMTAVATVEYGQTVLPGPTGEANTLSLEPRGRVLCLGPDGETLLAQVIQALAAGNGVLAIAPEASAILRSLLDADLPLNVLDASLPPELLQQVDVDAVACSTTAEQLRPLRQVLAAREGAIVPLITERIYPLAYAHERAVCVDTTAAGGNASLLATT